ncbi:hypothetical protein AVEN_267812-1 [Araneus ventricosus]|uniref:Uncharacterized protein n=1 Tax=Araneus ventricosus TaxID=182803 RepID=A0A4Y2D3D6_ARAVE|nr:hypothetical protein AVEN_267812-1 [Araneus ventricosus]
MEYMKHKRLKTTSLTFCLPVQKYRQYNEIKSQFVPILPSIHPRIRIGPRTLSTCPRKLLKSFVEQSNRKREALPSGIGNRVEEDLHGNGRQVRRASKTSYNQLNSGLMDYDTVWLRNIIRRKKVIGSSGNLNQGSSENLNQGSSENLNQGSSENLNQGSSENLNQGSSENLNQGSSENLKQGSSENLKQDHPENLKQGS